LEAFYGRSSKLIHSTYDVAVIGGGIAGAAAVISLAQAGIDVLWLRPKWYAESHKVGESLAPAANPILSSLGLSHLIENTIHRRANATFSAWGQEALVERNSAVHLEGAGNIINRVKFEHDLFLTASEACTLIIEDNLVSLSEDAGIWQLIASKGAQLNARFVIDATGRAQVVGKALIQNNKVLIKKGIRIDEKAHPDLIKSETSDHLVAAYCFLTQKENSNVQVTPATLLETVEDGWWYASLLPSGSLTLNYYSDPDLMPKGLATRLDSWLALIQQTKHIAYWLEDAEFVIDSPPQLASAATRWLSPAAGINKKAGWAAIGDAAVAFDPLSAHGITTALWAAARAPDFVKAHLAGNEQVLADYVCSVEKGRRDYLQQRNDLYCQEKRFQEYEFWKRRRAL
jgi:flavin-dependent dehydrogenase